jgi:hypothetical protein
MVGVQTTVVDPSGARETVLEGFSSIERGESIDLKGDAELKRFFEDVVSRGMKRLAAKRSRGSTPQSSIAATKAEPTWASAADQGVRPTKAKETDG